MNELRYSLSAPLFSEIALPQPWDLGSQTQPGSLELATLPPPPHSPEAALTS